MFSCSGFGSWGQLHCCSSAAWPGACVQPASLHCWTGKDQEAGYSPRPAVIPATRPRLSTQRQLLLKPPVAGPVILFRQIYSAPAQAPATVFSNVRTTPPAGVVIPAPIPNLFAVPRLPLARLAPSTPIPPADVSLGGRRPSRCRFYKWTVLANSCKKCGQYRTAETGHS